MSDNVQILRSMAQIVGKF